MKRAHFSKKGHVIKFIIISTLIFQIFCSFIALAENEEPEGVKPNSAPIAESQVMKTYKNIAISGQVSAVDPEGDMITFAVSKEPKKGTVTMQSDGSFSYTPEKGKKGKDSFTFVAVDVHGNISADATVTINIAKQSTDITYSDMEGNDAHYAALCLAENDIFIGARLGDDYYFSPDTPVTRGEFLVMCLNLCDIDKLSDITKTGFSDDEEMASWLKPYVAAGLMNGIVRGYNDEDGNVVFSSDKNITMAEAMVTLDNAISLSVVYSGPVNEVYPTWAQQSFTNLQACNIVSEDSVYNDEVTRAEAAKMLASAYDVINSR